MSDFKLKSDSGFESRSKNIFAGLDDIAADKEKPDRTSGREDERANDNTDDRRDLADEFKGRESIYRTKNESGWPPSRRHNDRPRFPPRNKRRGGPPDHVVNPQKYTKYSLSDVSRDQMSDRSNSRAAFDFLRQLKKDKREEGDEPAGEKIAFKKPAAKRASSGDKSSPSTSSSNVACYGNKRIMAECVVGQKVAKAADKKDDKAKKTKNRTAQLTLSHLNDEEDDE